MARQYQIVVFGATGYTGKLTAEYIAQNLPTDLVWGIAGRSESKLKEVAEVCRALNPDRTQPAILPTALTIPALTELAKTTQILITTVGPYAAHGEVAFAACAATGTHYIDCTGETPWTKRMIERYEKDAKATGAIMVPQSGIESAPTDLAAWMAVEEVRKETGNATGEVVLGVNLNAHISGGTFLTALSLLDHCSFKELNDASKPYSISPVPGPKKPSTSLSIWNRIFGVRTLKDIGVLTRSIQEASDVPIVHRSYGLFASSPKAYGTSFSFAQHSKTRNILTGFAMSLALTFGTVIFLLPPVRWLLKKIVTQPGNGASKEETKVDYYKGRTVAWPDTKDGAAKKGKRAVVDALWRGSMYEITALILAESAMTLLKDDDIFAKRLGGGVVTPATLGWPLVERLNKAGFQISAKIVEN